MLLVGLPQQVLAVIVAVRDAHHRVHVPAVRLAGEGKMAEIGTSSRR